MNVINIYVRELINFLKSIGRLDAIIPDDVMEEVYNNNYSISGFSDSISICKGTQVIKELRPEDLNLNDICLSLVTSGYARCPKCNSNDISYERVTPDGKGEYVCWDCEWSVPAS